MNIQPNIKIFQSTTRDVIDNASVDILAIPRADTPDNIDSDYVDSIRNQPLPNNIELVTISNAKDEIEDMIKLLGSCCREDSIEEAKKVIDSIHAKFNDKPAHMIKSWVRAIKGMHPKLDEYVEENKEYFKNPFSEVMGTNTILYYADTSSIDIWYWSKSPRFKNNRVEWFLSPWKEPTYIRESVRQKLPSEVVEYVQNANHLTSKLMRRNIIYDVFLTTEDGTGKQVPQERPIPYNVAHGSALNADWYHQNYRILDGERNKYWGKHDAIYKMYEPHPDGYLVHLLVNHITPLTPFRIANDDRIAWKSPLGVEETFPNRNSGLTVTTDSVGQKILTSSTDVNETAITPVEVTLPGGLT